MSGINTELKEHSKLRDICDKKVYDWVIDCILSLPPEFKNPPKHNKPVILLPRFMQAMVFNGWQIMQGREDRICDAGIVGRREAGEQFSLFLMKIVDGYEFAFVAMLPHYAGQGIDGTVVKIPVPDDILNTKTFPKKKSNTF